VYYYGTVLAAKYAAGTANTLAQPHHTTHAATFSLSTSPGNFWLEGLHKRGERDPPPNTHWIAELQHNTPHQNTLPSSAATHAVPGHSTDRQTDSPARTRATHQPSAVPYDASPYRQAAAQQRATAVCLFCRVRQQCNARSPDPTARGCVKDTATPPQLKCKGSPSHENGPCLKTS
jgi:hypothetical protein